MTNVVVGSYFNYSPEEGSNAAFVRHRNFTAVQEMYWPPDNNSQKLPAYGKPINAVLNSRDGKGVFQWSANYAHGPLSGPNMIGWRFLPSDPRTLGGVEAQNHAWSFSYEEGSPARYFSILDGFGSLGHGWRDDYGHFCGSPGNEYFLGVDAQSALSDVRRGLRKGGDRFEPWLHPYQGVRGSYIGRIVSKPGFVARAPQAGGAWQPSYGYQAFRQNFGWPPDLIEVDKYVFVCTRSGVSETNWAAVQQGFANARSARGSSLSPVFADGWTVGAWIPNSWPQLGMLVRVKDGAKYFLFVCESTQGWGETSGIPPDWNAAAAVPGDTVPDGTVTWRFLGQDPDSDCIVEDGTTEWTCAGPVAEFADYGPVYEKGFVTTRQNSPQETAVVDAYKLPVPTDKVCPVYVEVTVTCWDGSYAPAEAAVITLKSFWKPIAYDPYVLLGDIRSEGWGPISAEDFAVDRAEPFRVNLEYKDRSILVRVADFRGRNPGRPTITFPNRDIRWRSIRKPHIDWDW
jgi:hypothetical protein